MDQTHAARPRRRKGTSQELEIVALHGPDSALVRSAGGIAFYLPLSEIEEAAQAEPQVGPAASAGARPANPKRFDRWSDAQGQEWIFDQPRNPDGSYASDDASTELVESRLDWYPCRGPQVKAKHRPVLTD